MYQRQIFLNGIKLKIFLYCFVDNPNSKCVSSNFYCTDSTKHNSGFARSWVFVTDYKESLFVCLCRNRPSVDNGLLIHDVLGHPKKMHRIRKYSSELLICSSLRPQPDNKQHPHQADIHALGVIRTHNFSRRAATNLPLHRATTGTNTKSIILNK